MAENTIKDVKLKIGTESQFQSKLKDLPINTLVGTTDPIQEGELDTSIITKLNKADNALPKPTNDTTGSAGQVLKKTANGSEWGDAPSGGGKYYEHSIYSGATNAVELISIKLINSSATPLTIETISANNIKGFVNGSLYNERDMLFFPITSIEVKDGNLKVRYIGTNFSENYQTFTLTPFGSIPFDRVTELSCSPFL